MDRKTPLIVITGPTGSGKTAIALELARTYPLEAVSADSMQVYRHMDIATAKPSKAELSILPHHLINVAEPDEEFNAGMFARRARDAIHDILSRGKIPVIVGGTGLYIKALLYGLAPAPPRSNRIREGLTALADEKGSPFLWKILNRLDPHAARYIGVNDRVRSIRALEIVFLTGRKASAFHREHAFAEIRYGARIVCVMPDRARLYENIDTRVLRMVEKGLVEETRRLLDLGFGSALRSMQTLAYRHVIRHLESQIGLDEAVSLIQRDTRRYAKRQIIWMRSNYGPGSFCAPENAMTILSGLLRTCFPIGPAGQPV